MLAGWCMGGQAAASDEACYCSCGPGCLLPKTDAKGDQSDDAWRSRSTAVRLASVWVDGADTLSQRRQAEKKAR